MTTKEYTFYRIICRNPEIKDCYVGSTTQFRNRKCDHKCRSQNENGSKGNMYIYQFIRQNGGFKNFDMIEIEKLNLKTKQDALKRERYWLEHYNATLNQVMPSRTQKEYQTDNKDQISKLKKEYTEKNKDKIKEYHKQYTIANNEKLKAHWKEYNENNNEKIQDYKEKYYKENKEKLNEMNIKRYYENKEIYAEKGKEYREKNKEAIQERRKITTVCVCGSECIKSAIKRHERSMKHQQYLAEQELKNNIII